ncbi:hypothetical protein [Streptomyces winkii]|uniref:hypothetical protein n=1 Tax=Streptomyces winkii TaxID=3051178 RepID=UPI0028D7CA93|nr:hypothetical protein [Streptomyces sp. DSM 40971]
MDERGERAGGGTNNFSGQAKNVVQGQNIGSVSFQGGEQGIDSRFAGHWQEEIDHSDLLVWNLRLNGSFSAHCSRRPTWNSQKMRLLAKKWYGEWRVSMEDPAHPWIEFVATDVDSPALGFASILLGQPEQKRGVLSRLDRSANITHHSQNEFSLSWTGNGGSRVMSVWTRLG